MTWWHAWGGLGTPFKYVELKCARRGRPGARGRKCSVVTAAEYCFGCNAFICENHDLFRGIPGGPHKPGLHDFPEGLE